jgi:putative SOS response-associated peptidase YedK
MCGRSSLHDAPVSVLEKFELPPVLPGFRPRYNIAPTQDQWTISLDARQRPVASPRRWGLIPSWAGDPSIGSRMINARADTLANKPAFRDLVHSQRCVILADGYYEWTGEGKARVPMFFHLAGHAPFAMAGIYDRWRRGDATFETCTVITTDATARVSEFHHRMPVVLPMDAAVKWVDRGTPLHEALALLRGYEGADLVCYEVSRFVNSPANDTPECLAPRQEGLQLDGLL